MPQLRGSVARFVQMYKASNRGTADQEKINDEGSAVRAWADLQHVARYPVQFGNGPAGPPGGSAALIARPVTPASLSPRKVVAVNGLLMILRTR